MQWIHQPVMLRETVSRLITDCGGVYVDATAGSGGHAEAILERLADGGRLVAVDCDAAALERCRERLAARPPRLELLHGNFARLDELLEPLGVAAVDGILMDLGMSSDQVESAERGFGFRQEGPLDMRMNPTGEAATAQQIVDEMSEPELRALLQAGGARAEARRVARAIVSRRASRPVAGTRQLAELVSRATGGRKGKRHPATRVFQALRMAVNDELRVLRTGLDVALNLLRPGGRLAVIAFHSLEDQEIKRCFTEHRGRWVALQQGGRRWEGRSPSVRWIDRGAVTPAAAETAHNPRSRSAKLRVVERAQPVGWEQRRIEQADRPADAGAAGSSGH